MPRRGQGSKSESNGKKSTRQAGGTGDADAIPNEWHKRSAELNPKYKSQLCKNFMDKGPDGCRFGDDCVFAHGSHELRVAQKDDILTTSRRPRGNKPHNEGKQVQFKDVADEPQCFECSSRPVSPVHDEEPEAVPEWATADTDPTTAFSFDTFDTPMLVRSDSVLAADKLFLSDAIDTSTVADGPVVYGEELNSRFSFATATPREVNPKHWTSSQVVAWVRSKGIADEVAGLFAEHEVDGESLLCMTKEDLRDVGVTKMGPLLKLSKGIAQLSGTASTPAGNTEPVVVTDALKTQAAGTADSCSSSSLKDLARLEAALTSMVSAQAVGASQLIAEAAEVLKHSDNVPALNDVLQSAVMANKIAEVIRGESDTMSLTLCMLAAKYGRVSCLERLLRELSAQETINAVRVDDGCSALHLAAYRGSAGCVRLLLKAGANPNLINSYGETAADCAVKRGHGSLSDLCAQPSTAAASPLKCDSITPSRQPSERFVKILHPRRHAKKSRDTLAWELSAWRNGSVAPAA